MFWRMLLCVVFLCSVGLQIRQNKVNFHFYFLFYFVINQLNPAPL